MQEDQQGDVEYFAKKYADVLIEGGPAFSLISSDGIVWGCAGIIELEPHRCQAWALIRDGIGHVFPVYHREVHRFLCKSGYNRVEMAVRVGFEQGERWGKMLGFELEGYMKRYYPNGDDAYLYARVK